MPDAPQPSTPTGQPDRRDRDAWLLLALIGDDDVEAAQRYWRDHAPQAFAGAPLGRDGWEWDDQKQIYVADNRHKLDQDHLKRLALLFALAAAADLRQLGSDVASGKTPIDQWQSDVADLAKRTAVTQGALAAGGFDKLTDEVRRIITGEPGKAPGLAFSMDRLRGFADDIDQYHPSAAAIMDRASLYSSAANGTHEAVKRESHREAKNPNGQLLYLYEKNILSPGVEDHCMDKGDLDGCWNITQQGWVPIGSLPLIGQRQCGPNCQCSLAFSLTGPATENQ